MKQLLRSCSLIGLLLVLPTVVAAQWVTIDFQDPLPFTMVWPSGSRDLTEIGGPGTCGPRVFWNRVRVAPDRSLGYNNRGFVRYTFCNVNVSQSGYNSETAGWTESGRQFEPGQTSQNGQNNWPDTFFGRFRMYIEQPIIIAPGGDDGRQLKFFLWHTGVYGGDQRVIGFLENGSNCGISDSAGVCFTLQRNINHQTDTTAVSLPVGQWSHIQFSWRHGPQGTSFVKIWKNSNNSGSPTAQDLVLNGVPSQPGGTTTWMRDNVGYDGGFNIGNAANNGTRFGRTSF